MLMDSSAVMWQQWIREWRSSVSGR